MARNGPDAPSRPDAIETILLHRVPFLLVDRVTELEFDKRIVGVKNVSLNDRCLSHVDNGAPALPPLDDDMTPISFPT